MQEGRPAQRTRIGKGLGTLGRVEDQLDAAVLDGVDDMRPAFREPC